MHRSLHDIMPPVIIGHRGFRAGYPENTLVSFSAAMNAGADMIELDVTLSRDRQVVVIHDDTLNRTTSGAGPVHQATLDQLKRLDAGVWFDSRFAGEPLPTLEQVLILAGKNILINVEIKSSAWEPGAPKDAIEKQVVDMIIRHDLLNSLIISSFHAGFLENIGCMTKHPSIAYITDRDLPRNALELCARLGVFSWHPHYQSVKQRLVEKAHALGILVFPYTVNSAEEMRRLVNMGADGVITDDPRAAVACLASTRRTPASTSQRD